MGTTHLEIHTGKTRQIRATGTTPTSPTPATGDIYFDTTDGAEAIGIYKVSGWVYVSTLSA